jgi:hypothetical protein
MNASTALLRALSFGDLIRQRLALDYEVLRRTWWILALLLIVGAIFLWVNHER